MKQRYLSIIFLLGITIFVSGCSTTAGALKQQNKMVNFVVKDHYENVASRTLEMLESCDSFHHLKEKKVFPTIKKAEVSMLDMKGAFYYYLIDIELIDDNNSNVTVFTEFDNSHTRMQTLIIKDWILNKSTDCQNF